MSELSKALKGLQAAYTDLLFDRVARKLTGYPVKIVTDDPPLPNTRGLMLKDGLGLVIYLKPNPDQEQYFQTYLHECAHGRLHRSGLADIADISNVLEVRQMQGKRAAPVWLMDARRKAHDKREEEAREQAAIWLDYANRKAPSDGLRGKLLALLDWKP